jgi:hypothetical protein
MISRFLAIKKQVLGFSARKSWDQKISFSAGHHRRMRMALQRNAVQV